MFYPIIQSCDFIIIGQKMEANRPHSMGLLKLRIYTFIMMLYLFRGLKLWTAIYAAQMDIKFSTHEWFISYNW